MHKIYLVLRNNQQSGPFSLEELLQLPLKPHDLVWVEGQSAGWRYPAEIDALKPHIQPTAQPPAATAGSSPESHQQKGLPITTTAIPSSGKTLPPRHIYVSLPAGKSSTVPPEPTSDADPLEKKAQELYQRVQAYSQTHQASKEEEPPHPAPRSVEQMRQDYAKWMEQQKKKKKQGQFLKQFVVTAVVLLLVATGFFMAQWMEAKEKATQPQNTTDPGIQAVPVSNDSVIQQQLNNFTSNTETYIQPLPQVWPADNDPKQDATNPDALQKQPLSVKKGQTGSSLILPPGATTRPSSKAAKEDTTQQQAPIAAYTPPAPGPKEAVEETEKRDKRIIPLSQLIQLQGQPVLDKRQKQVTGMEITLHNNSTETLKTIAVTILYYKKGEKLLGKETLYFTNVQPQSTATLGTTTAIKAASAQYHIASIIRQDGSLYLIR